MSDTAPSKLSARDDELHAPRALDPTWAETCWFSAQVPERRIGIWTYPLFRTNLGIMSCAIYVWGEGTGELWRQPYYRQYWHQPIPDGFRLSDFELPLGLSYKVIKPLTEYHVRYQDGDAISLDLHFTAIHPAHELGISGGTGHIDQLGRVQGEIILAGEKLSVDCIEMRDRTWSPRRERRDGTWLSYSYGAVDDKNAFHCATRLGADREIELLGGFTLRDGTMRELREGSRRVERDDVGRPVRVFVSGVDQDGGAVEAVGTVETRMAMNTSPYFVFVSGVRWRLADGTEAWGEDQDTWSPGMLRELMPDLLAGRR
jgi:hypothetical protein